MLVPLVLSAQHTLIKKDGFQIACLVKGVANGNLTYTLDPSASKTMEVSCADVLAYIDESLIVHMDPCVAAARPAAETVKRNCASLIQKDRSVIKGSITHFMDDYVKMKTTTGERNVPLSDVVFQLAEDGEIGFDNKDLINDLLSDQTVVMAMNNMGQCPSAMDPVRPSYSSKRAKPKFEGAARKSPATAKKDPVAGTPAITYVDTVTRGMLEVLDFDTFKTIALAKVARLGGYIGQIADKKISMTQRDKAVGLGLALFERPESNTVQVSKLMPGGPPKITNKKVMIYLQTDLKYNKYDNVKIEWADLNYTSDFEEQPDGSYVAVISIQQRFKGMVDGVETYSDVTNKNITVTIRSYEKFDDGGFKKLWDVFLGDIGVSSTHG